MKHLFKMRPHYAVLLTALAVLCQTAYAADAALTPAPADGWASQSGGTIGGATAAPANIYAVTNRAQLLLAISTAKNLPKIIKVVGTIDMSEGVPFATREDQKARGEIKLTSNTTLFGDGTNAGIINGFISVTNISQVIIRNLKIVNPCDVGPVFDPNDGPAGNWNSEFDAITVQNSKNVWIDHNTFTDAPKTDELLPIENGQVKQCHDGSLDIKNGSDFVTVSFNLFDLHSKNNLIGSSDSSTVDEGHLTITFSNNLWRNIAQRAPRVRFGMVHLFNNYFLGSKTHPVYAHLYSVGAGKAAKIISQNNNFEIAGATTCDDVVTNPNVASPVGAFKDTGSILNGKLLGPCAVPNTVSWTIPYAYSVRPISLVKATVLANAGSGKLTTTVVGTTPTSSSSSSVASSVPSSSSSSSAESSSSSSSVSSASSSTAPAALWNEPFSAVDRPTFLSAGYAAQPSGAAMYAVVGGSTFTFTGTTLTIAGSRFSIGAENMTASTAASAPPGIFDLAGKTCTLTVDVTAASGAGNFQVYINNNTTGAANSPLGSASRVVNRVASSLTIGQNVFTWANVGTSTSFLMLRTESAASVTMDNASLNCGGSAASSSSVASSSVASSSVSSSASSSVASSSSSSSVASSSSSSVVPVATESGGFATTKGGNIAGARFKTAATFEELNAIIAAARIDDNGVKVTSGAYPLVITYTGNEDAKIAQIVADHTVDAAGNCPNPHWNDPYREVSLKDFTGGVTILGADGSSANFGITIVNSGNVVIRNMKIGALAGANSDADMIRIDNSPNVWIDHNELFAVNNECNGSPDGDLTFESAIDIKKAATNITVSYNYIHDSKKVGLDGSGASDIAGGRQITFHHNLYSNVESRLPLQRGGWAHMYNNLYSNITGSGINVRTGGNALIENNWFENSFNPITCRFDTVNCGKWDLRGNNLTSAADNATYGIQWTSPGTNGVNADTWTTTGAFPITLPYTYTAQAIACVKANLPSVVGVGKGLATLTCN